ncbi:MAG: acyl-CoA dehydratase activase-related protein [Gemmatimonadota bacterium]|nr:acyl-CoA dehydratase activase-related protein [Gemmatimonadota bacterium]
MNAQSLSIGIDVGSTTVKAVLIDTLTDAILWQDYQRHEGRQLSKVLELLTALHADVPEASRNGTRAFATGSGAAVLEDCLGAKFVQEVNAVALAVERLHPEVGSVVELGGQDAKIVIFRDDPSGGKKKIPTMNDKCAGGTGAVLDKISAKLGIPPEQLAQQRYAGIRLHHVAGKCGVFAETDINSLQLVGIPTDQLMASLFDAIVGQNLSVLTRGHTLRPHVLLLGGPNTFIEGMAEAWKANIPPIWEEREVPLPEGVDPTSLIYVPDNALYFAAIGAVDYGRNEDESVGRYSGLEGLRREIERSGGETRAVALPGLSKSAEELEQFKRKYERQPFVPATFERGQTVRAVLGLDGGSTSTKGVLLDENSRVLVKAYQLSKGNPIEDTKEIVAKLRASVEDHGAALDIIGFGVTGYAKDVLKDVFGADVAIVETVAHTSSALHFYDDVDVICDVGGQDIKIMILKDGHVKDFKLNTQCSAGNGYFLQSTAQSLGVPVEEYADVAFRAESMPTFGYGCAVFMQTDIVNFQRQGWTPEQIMAGLAAVLPKNIWLYVAQMPNLARLGTRFVLQGGTQHNLAAVKSQVDFIRERFHGKDVEPDIVVHEHCGESGAIGAGLEALRIQSGLQESSFIGLDETAATTYTTTTNESTRCHFCKNKCLRTFIDVRVASRSNGSEAATVSQMGKAVTNGSKVPLAAGARRLIVGNSCEKGLVESVGEMRVIKARLDTAAEDTPNLVDAAASNAFRSYEPTLIADRPDRLPVTTAARRRAHLMEARPHLRIGIPRVLSLFSVAPIFRAYFESLGVQSRNVVFSDKTSADLYRAGAKRGSIDPCFPSKLAIPHVHNLLYKKHERAPLDIIFFPMVDDVPSEMAHAIGHRICPTITATPEATRAAFTKEVDVFAQKGVRFMNTFVNMGQPALFERQMYEAFQDVLGVSPVENQRAIQAGMDAHKAYTDSLRAMTRDELRRLERENRIGIVLLSRPYHADQGINHDILAEFQKLGYPIFTPSSLPVDGDVIESLFGDEVRAGIIEDPLDIRDVWKNAYSENSNWKLWAAKFAARHPNLIAMEINNFRCGHDAPIFAVIEGIVEAAGTPIFTFRDLDENKPAGSIKIRVETIHYFLQRFGEGLAASPEAQERARDVIHYRGEPFDTARAEAPLIQLRRG